MEYDNTGDAIVKRLLFIFNPQSGKARIRGQLFEIVEFYTNAGYLVTVYPTSATGDAYSFLTVLEEEYDLIVCSGGDGTLNEVVAGLLDSRNKTPLGYIPSGSTNDFGRSVGIPTELGTALEISCAGNLRKLDIGRLNGRYFVYVAAFGAFTRVSYVTSQKMKNALGHLAYLLQGIKELSELHPYELSLRYEGGEITGRYIVGLIMNSFSIGGFKNPVGALTELNDGVFEVILIKMPQNVLELQGVIAALLGDPQDSEHIVCFQTSRMEIQSEMMEWTVDGEYGGRFEQVTVENYNRAIEIVTGIG